MDNEVNFLKAFGNFDFNKISEKLTKICLNPIQLLLGKNQRANFFKVSNQRWFVSWHPKRFNPLMHNA